MPKILITPAAEDDLINLWMYIARDNRSAADKVYAAEQTFASLVAMPEIGTLYQPKRLWLNGIRFYPIKQFHNYVIYYKPIADGIEIIRVLHARMNRDRKLGEN
ncbi:type II toxin-antitoxin system RelE/ParE family toxin [Desulfobulbus alkaliphilus]|uniref:type II toxin-antitoxin system RelE/ParE family toxin n=1 Tax=Desulfobulbus alkaliphilus TaxID=869814 RepID=UPI00196593A7|nr:type II toxin-antitoxin system RelE/ParE family toxin [Desulfobulbus alkaliphilus]MBM9537079.1 type II toxin-antitoxin system RelE/ParE family toxin [Desulfobulbus alkaliphilus]